MKQRIFSFVMLAIITAKLCGQSNTQKAPQPPQPARSAAREMLYQWNSIGKRLVAMAEDFPEDKYSFKAQKDERTFGENLVHVADEDYRLMSAIKGSPMVPVAGRNSGSTTTRAKPTL